MTKKTNRSNGQSKAAMKNKGARDGREEHGLKLGEVNEPRYALLKYEDVDPRVRDNPFLRTGYRPLGLTYLECFYSSFERNNQRCNIWTSVAGAVINVLFCYDIFSGGRICGVDMREGSYIDRMWFLSWFFTLVLMNVASAMAHTFCVRSANVFWKWFQFDIVCFTSMAFSYVYGQTLYKWALPAWLRLPYLVAAYGSVLGFIVILLYWNVYFPDVNKVYKVFAAVGVAIISSLPLWQRMLVDFSFMWFIGLAVLLFSGLLFAGFVPERIAIPGLLDFEFYSHPLWHIGVVCSFMIITMAMLEDHLSSRGLPIEQCRFKVLSLLLVLAAFGAFILRTSVVIYLYRNEGPPSFRVHAVVARKSQSS